MGGSPIPCSSSRLAQGTLFGLARQLAARVVGRTKRSLGLLAPYGQIGDSRGPREQSTL